MTPGDEPIRITRGWGGQVEVKGPIDELAAHILIHAGFIFQPALSGVWIRLHFDTGQDRENRKATHAARMLGAAGYQVDLDPNLLPAAGHHAPVNWWPPRLPPTQPPPGRQPCR